MLLLVVVVLMKVLGVIGLFFERCIYHPYTCMNCVSRLCTTRLSAATIVLAEADHLKCQTSEQRENSLITDVLIWKINTMVGYCLLQSQQSSSSSLDSVDKTEDKLTVNNVPNQPSHLMREMKEKLEKQMKPKDTREPESE